MAAVTLYKGINLNAQTLYDFTDEDLASISTQSITYNPPAGGAQVYTGFFEFDLNGDASAESEITAIDTLDNADSQAWSLSGINLPVSVYEAYIESDAITGIQDSSALMEYILRGHDQMTGSNEADSAVLFTGNDSFVGLDGNDFVNGHFGNDTLNGHIGNDTIRGGAGNDNVRGGSDNDILFGDKGQDKILGDMGNDTLYGGEGADQFIFKPGNGSDVIVDFEASDQILIYMRASVQDISDIDVTISNGNTILGLGFGEEIMLYNYDNFSTENIILIA